MKKRILFLISLFLFCAVLLCACASQEDEPKDGSMIPVTESSGEITGYERYSHNDEGYLSRVDYFNANEEYDHYIIYEYDSQGRVSLETCYSANGIGQYFYDYRYDDEGNLEKVTYATQTEGYSVTSYEGGAEKEKFSYDNKGNLISHQEMQNGEWVETPYEEETENTDEINE